MSPGGCRWECGSGGAPGGGRSGRAGPDEAPLSSRCSASDLAAAAACMLSDARDAANAGAAACIPSSIFNDGGPQAQNTGHSAEEVEGCGGSIQGQQVPLNVHVSPTLIHLGPMLNLLPAGMHARCTQQTLSDTRMSGSAGAPTCGGGGAGDTGTTASSSLSLSKMMTSGAAAFAGVLFARDVDAAAATARRSSSPSDSSSSLSLSRPATPRGAEPDQERCLKENCLYDPWCPV